MLFGGLMHAGSVPVFALVMLLFMPIAVECVCPWCFGGLPSCTYDSNKKCPCDTTISENIALVAAVSSATAIAGGKYFKMPGVLAAKYLRMFTSASLAALLRLCLKSTAGTDFELLATTTVAEAMQAIRNGQITAADAIVGFGGFIDAAADEAAERKLASKAKTIAEARDAGLLEVGLSSNADQCGPWLFLWVKISNFVMVRATALSSVMVETGEGKPPATVTVKVAAFESEFEFFEALNLFIMWTTALGLGSAVCVASFLEDFVFDTIRARGYTWQFAAVFLVVVLQHLEDSEGRLTLMNAIHQVHLQSLLSEAEVTFAHLYPKVGASFRPPPAAAGRGGGGESSATTAKWNGKSSASSFSTCDAYNTGREHQARHLLPDGTCRYKHACDKWVSDKGPAGKCLQAHSRVACSNPNRCDAKVEPKQQ
jgi:hypothetical protein